MSVPVRSGTGYCAALWCNNSKSRHPNLSFFRFPKDKERCKAWLKYSKRDDLLDLSPDQLYTGFRLCSRHFDKSQYITAFKKGKLVKSACPTVEESSHHERDQSPDHRRGASNSKKLVELSSDSESEIQIIQKESNVDTNSNVAPLVLECESAASDTIPIPQRSYLSVNSDIVTLLLECESEPYAS